jgi:tight adherence protein B
VNAAAAVPNWLKDPPVPYLAVAAVVFLSLLILALVILAPMLMLAQKRRRLIQLERYRLAQVQTHLAATAVRSGALTRTALHVTERMMRSGGLEDRFARQLDRAGMSMLPHEWVLLRVTIAVGLAVLLTFAFGPIGLPFGLLFGWLASAAYHRRRARLKSERFAAQLPEALQLIIGSLRSGFSLPQAIDAMLKETGETMGAEFGRAMAETRLGMSLDDALERLAKRAQNQDLSWAVMAIRVQREVGGNLAEVLSSTVEAIRERERLRGHVRALSAEGRISAWILLALPLGSTAFMITFRREYISPLFTDPRGIFMLLVGVTLLCVGGFWLSRVVKVEI